VTLPQPSSAQLHNFLRGRRSTRRFKQKSIPSDVLERILETAIYAPNAHNAQSWRFIHLESKESRKAISAAMGAEFRTALEAERLNPEAIDAQLERSRKRNLQAPTAILICIDQSALKSYQDESRTLGEEQMAAQSAAMAGGQLLLAAHAEGVGAVWVCAPLFTPKEVAQALELPASWQAQGIIYLGYPAKTSPDRPRKPLQDVFLSK
jgi:F420 biosynthesis protein FbiB-like protein